MKVAVRDYNRDREILYLRNIRGWTFVKIGQKYDITKGRVRMLYSRAVEDRKREEESKKQMKIGA